MLLLLYALQYDGQSSTKSNVWLQGIAERLKADKQELESDVLRAAARLEKSVSMCLILTVSQPHAMCTHFCLKKLQGALAQTARQEASINIHRFTGLVTYAREGRITTAYVVTSILPHSQPTSVIHTPGQLLCLQAARQLLSTAFETPL